MTLCNMLFLGCSLGDFVIPVERRSSIELFRPPCFVTTRARKVYSSKIRCSDKEVGLFIIKFVIKKIGATDNMRSNRYRAHADQD